MNTQEKVSENAAADIQIDIQIADKRWGNEETLREMLFNALEAALIAAKPSVLAQSEVSFLFTDDAAIKKLNSEWRGKDKPTNVLSFPGTDTDEDFFGPLLGDVVLAYDTVAHEAEQIGIDFRDHMSHLTIHGLLHLFGYDHEEDDEANLMESLEIAALASIGVQDPYN